MITKLKLLIETTNTRVLAQVIKSKANLDLYNWIMNETDALCSSSTMKERVHYIIVNKPDLTCVNGNTKKYVPKINEYKFCGNTTDCACFRDSMSIARAGMDMTDVIEKRKITWLTKYGVENASKSPEVIEKRRVTMSTRNYEKVQKNMQLTKETQGFEQVVDRVKHIVTPLFSREEYIGSFRKNFYLWKCTSCGNEFEDHVDYGREPRCQKCFPSNVSAGEIELRDWIKSLEISIVENDRSILNNLEIDIYIPGKKIAIEYNGIYWHSSKFKDKKYHVKKFLDCKKQGIHLIQIFEDEWKVKTEIVKSRLLSTFGKGERIYARKCQVVKISPTEHKQFMLKYHLQGYATASIAYGLKFNGNLVAAMSFSKARYSKVGYELVRFCSIGNIIGGASKLFTAFVRDFSPSLVTSYANRCWSNGNLYIQLDFLDVTKDEENTGFWYIKNNKRSHRSTFNKQRLVKLGYDSSKTGKEIMSDAGYVTIFDCGNYKFEWRPKT